MVPVITQPAGPAPVRPWRWGPGPPLSVFCVLRSCFFVSWWPAQRYLLSPMSPPTSYPSFLLRPPVVCWGPPLLIKLVFDDPKTSDHTSILTTSSWSSAPDLPFAHVALLVASTCHGTKPQLTPQRYSDIRTGFGLVFLPMAETFVFVLLLPNAAAPLTTGRTHLPAPCCGAPLPPLSSCARFRDP